MYVFFLCCAKYVSTRFEKYPLSLIFIYLYLICMHSMYVYRTVCKIAIPWKHHQKEMKFNPRITYSGTSKRSIYRTIKQKITSKILHATVTRSYESPYASRNHRSSGYSIPYGLYLMPKFSCTLCPMNGTMRMSMAYVIPDMFSGRHIRGISRKKPNMLCTEEGLYIQSNICVGIACWNTTPRMSWRSGRTSGSTTFLM